ncbi:MFS transporter, partial [Actinomadura kijaniata]
PAARVDWWGAALFAGVLVAALTALTQGMDWGWTSPGVTGLSVLAAALLAVWLRVESRVAEPLVDLRLMRRRGVWTANAASVLSGYALMAGGVLFPLLVQLPASTGFGFGGTATQAAMLQLPAGAAMTVAGMAAGTLHRRVGSRAVLLAGAVLTGGGYGFVALWHDAVWQLYAGGVA